MMKRRVYFAQYGAIWSVDPLAALDIATKNCKDAGNYDLSEFKQLKHAEWCRVDYELTEQIGHEYCFRPIDADEEAWDEFRDLLIHGLGSGDLYCSDKDSTYYPKISN